MTPILHAIVLTLTLGSIGADAYTTQQIWSHSRPYELNPISRTFVSHGEGERAAYFTGYAATVALVDRKWGHKHRKLTLIGEIGIVAMEGVCVNYNIRHGRID